MNFSASDNKDKEMDVRREGHIEECNCFEYYISYYS